MITYILIGITVMVSYAAFQNTDLWNKCMFYPVAIKHDKEWWRFLSHGFIHADFQHLIFNMLTLYFMGRNVEHTFEAIFDNQWMYPFFYISALFVSSIPSYFKHNENRYYQALGASGAVSAVLFANIVFDPWATIGLNFIIPVPAILFAIGYLVYSNYMSKNGRDNIGHDAHFYGSLYGVVFPFLWKPALFPYFIEQLQHPRFLS